MILATVTSLSLTYGSPEASCIKRADTYSGRTSASYGRNNPIFEYWSYVLFVDL